MPSVLFVCTANICRSPIASALFRGQIAQRSDAKHWRVASAGVWAMEGSQAARFSRAVVEKRGFDLSSHRAQGVSRELLRRYNLILTMEQGHKEALRAEFPGLADRIFVITEMVERKGDIADPMGGALVDYEDTARELEEILTLGMEKIVSLATARQSKAANDPQGEGQAYADQG